MIVLCAAICRNLGDVDNMALAKSQLSSFRMQAPITNYNGLDSGSPAHRGIVDFGRLHKNLTMATPQASECGDSDDSYW